MPRLKREVGAAWKREDSEGRKFIRIRLFGDKVKQRMDDESQNTVYLKLILNKYKEPGTKQPDYIVLFDDYTNDISPTKDAELSYLDSEYPF